MRYNFTIKASVALAGFVLLFSCNKNNSTPATESHVIKARVVEYGTDNSISEAVLSVWSSTKGNITTTTDKNGSCTIEIEGKYISFRSFSKEGYWDYNFLDKQFSPLILFPAYSTFDQRTGIVNGVDSIVLKLFPKSYITLHIKDSLGFSSCPGCTKSIDVNGTFRHNGNIYTVYDEILGSRRQTFLYLRSNIDTSIQIAIFGNTINHFDIRETDLVFDNIDYINSYYHRQSEFIPANSNLVLNISY
jgi:hypothetical protein